MPHTQFTLSYLLFICLFALSVAHPALGQRTLGVQWSAPAEQQQALAELDTLGRLGIELLEISSPLHTEIWEHINDLGFRVYANLPVNYPLVQSFANPDSMTILDRDKMFNEYLAQPSVEAIGLFKYGAVHRPDFLPAIGPYLRILSEEFSGSFYYTTVRKDPFPIDQNTDFNMLEIRVRAGERYSEQDSLPKATGVVIYQPESEISMYLTPFNNFLEHYKEKSVPILVSANWLFSIMEKYPDFADVVQLYNSDSEFVFPVPRENYSVSGSHSLIVLLMVLIWCLLAITYHMSPVYRKSAARYFLGHAFFVEDVMKRHIRSVEASLTIILLNMLLAGITLYCISQTSFSYRGLEALIYHYPAVSLLKSSALSLFIWGCVISAGLTVISILLIRLGNKTLKSFRQVVNLYAWPLQLNFILTTIIVTLLKAGNYPRMILTLTILIAMVHIAAFIVTVIDSSKYMSNQKGLFLAGGVAVYLVLLAAGTYWFLVSDMPEVLQLATFL